MTTIRREGLDFSVEFTMIPNRWTRDGRLTLKAAGLLMLLLSHRAGWVLSIRQLATERLEGREAIMAAVAELETFGYLRREQLRGPNGQLGDSIWTILDPDVSSPQAPSSENPTTVEKPRSEPTSDYPTSAEPTSGRSTTKKTNTKKTNPEEHQGNGAAPASENQREYLRDLHLHGGGRSPDEIDAWLLGLSSAEADAEIKDALRALPRGRDYAGDPENPGLSPKGQAVAKARLIPPKDT